MNLDLTIARQCLRIASRAYPEMTIEDGKTNTQLLLGTLAEDSTALVIGFRGSRELKDFLQDARFIAKTPWCNGGVISQLVKVHRGFNECYFSVADRLRELASTASRILITGHSLGGALALMCALDLTQHGHDIEAVHTFGCPRVGNGAWRNLYNANLHDQTCRWEAQGDLVPYGPPWINGYRHAGRECYLPNAGGMEIEPVIWNKVVPIAQSVIGGVKDVERANFMGLFDPHHLSNYERLFGQLKEAA